MTHLVGEGEVIAHAIDRLERSGFEHPFGRPEDQARCGIRAVDRVEELLG